MAFRCWRTEYNLATAQKMVLNQSHSIFVIGKVRERAMKDQDGDLELLIEKFLPLMCVISFFGTVGVVGNTFAIMFYFKRRNSSTSILILYLAFSDFMVCINFYLLIIEMCTSVILSNKIFCKVRSASMAWFVYSSAAILWIISVDRYFKICRPFHRQLSVKRAKVLVLVAVFITALISARILFTQTLIEVPIKGPHQNTSYILHFCDEPTDSELKEVLLGFHVLEAFCLLCSCLTLIISYAIIVKSLIKHAKELKYFLTMGNGHTGSTSRPVVSIRTDISNSTSDKNTDTESNCDLTTVSNEENLASDNEHTRNGAISNTIKVDLHELDTCSTKTQDQECSKQYHEERFYTHERVRRCPDADHDIDVDNTPKPVCSDTVEYVQNERVDDNADQYRIITRSTVSNTDTDDDKNSNKAGKTQSSETFENICKSDNRSNPNNIHVVEKETCSKVKNESGNGNQTIHSRSGTHSVKRSEKKATVLMFVVSFLYICCFLPYLLMTFTHKLWSTGLEEDYQLVTWIPFLLPYLNSVINPIVYFSFNRRFRRFVIEKFINVFRLCRNRPTSSI